MLRVLSAAVLLPIVIATIWLLPPVATLALAEVVVVLAFLEYAGMARALGATIPVWPAGIGAAAVCATVALNSAAEVTIMAATIAVASLAVAAGQPRRELLQDLAASVFPLLYLGLPLGALASVRATEGPGPVLALMLTVIISDSAQYYGGRTMGRTPLAPSISPKKTTEGALSGLLAGLLALPIIGQWWLPEYPASSLALIGAAVVVLGIVGDLFESLLKRSAGVKDSSGLIPGHGGMLDRIDSLLFAAPVYYAFLRYSPY